MAGHVFAHGGRVAKLGGPASNMALTYHIHLWKSAFSKITYCYNHDNDKMLTYGPGNIFYRPTGTVYSHSFSGEQFYLALILLKVIWVEAIFSIIFSWSIFLLKYRKLTRLCLWTLKSSHPIMAINDKKWSFKKIPTSYSPTVALIGWKHSRNSYFKRINEKKNLRAFWTNRHGRHLEKAPNTWNSFKKYENYAVLDVKKTYFSSDNSF